MQPNCDSTSKQFTRQYYMWLEDINRYESKNGQRSITDHVKTATIINRLKRPIAQHLMLRVNHAEQTETDKYNGQNELQLSAKKRECGENLYGL
eukprot:4236453-Amphidinium_carterae.1